MKTILFGGIAAAALSLGATSAGASESLKLPKAERANSMVPLANGRRGGTPIATGTRHMRIHPRPGMFGIPQHDVYRRPFRGFIVPRYWVQPRFYVYNFRNYGLAAPSNGYVWSRYYDDAVLMDNRGYVQDYRPGVDWDAGYAPGGDLREPEYGPSIRADRNIYDIGQNGEPAFAAPDGASYSYDGQWDGEFVDPEGRVFEGDWSGRVTRHGGVAGPGYPAPRGAGAPFPEPEDAYEPPLYEDDGYNVPPGYENYERCLKSNGVTGAAIGALLGGIAGNRIAGRGDRLGGTLIGAGVGGLLGAAVEKANDKCRHHRPRGPRPPMAYGYGNGWQGGYYYYPQAPLVTVTVAPAVTTTTVTEEVYYETIPAPAPRKRTIRKWKPKAKPRCVCR